MKQSLLLKCYHFIFSESYISLKKYTRTLYAVSFLLLLANISSLTILEQYSTPISDFLDMDLGAYEVLISTISLRLNIVEASLGIVGVMLDFIPAKVGLE